MGRINLPKPEDMTIAQKAVYDAVVAGPRGTVVGPLRAAIHNPSLADKWQQFGQVLRYETSLPKSLNELAILLAARRWNSHVEWAIHAKEAEKAGLPKDIIASVCVGELPDFAKDEAAREVYEYARQLLLNGNVDDACYAALLARWGEAGVVELTAVVGYYSMVAMTLNVHQIPMPDGCECSFPFPEEGLFVSPKSQA